MGAQVRDLGIYGRLLHNGALNRHRRIHDDDAPTAVCCEATSAIFTGAYFFDFTAPLARVV